MNPPPFYQPTGYASSIEAALIGVLAIGLMLWVVWGVHRAQKRSKALRGAARALNLEDDPEVRRLIESVESGAPCA